MKIVHISAVWCPACLIMKNRWAKVAETYPHFVYEDYDYDNDEDYCKILRIESKLPVSILIENNQEIGRIIGEKTEKELYKILEEYGVKE